LARHDTIDGGPFRTRNPSNSTHQRQAASDTVGAFPAARTGGSAAPSRQQQGATGHPAASGASRRPKLDAGVGAMAIAESPS